MVMADTVIPCTPTFESATILDGLAVPTIWLAKIRFAGDRFAIVHVPERVTV